MLDCVKDNVASWKTITALGGYLVKEEKEYQGKRVVIQDYDINVNESLDRYRNVYEQYITTQQEEKTI